MNKDTDKKALLKALRELNPSAGIIDDFDKGMYDYIFTNVSATELKLPAPFYYNEKNGITNKHKTESGLYIALDVVSL